MKSNQFFDIGRFVNTVKADLLPKRRTILIMSLAAMGLMLLITFFGAFSNFSVREVSQSRVYSLFNYFFPVVAFIAGLFLTAATFSPLADSRIAHGYLGVPASHFEKYLSKWFVTGPLYILGAMAVLALTALLVKVKLAIYPGTSLDLGTMLQTMTPSNIAEFMVPHAAFLLGAIAFKRLAFWKTMLTIFVTFFAWVVFTGFSFRVMFAKYFTGNTMTIKGDNISFDGAEFFGMGLDDLWWVGAAMSLLVWTTFNVAGYFKLKETEV